MNDRAAHIFALTDALRRKAADLDFLLSYAAMAKERRAYVREVVADIYEIVALRQELRDYGLRF